MCESKHFSEGVAIKNHGEFTAFFNHKPIAFRPRSSKNERHILILKRILDAGMVDLPTLTSAIGRLPPRKPFASVAP